MTDVTLVASTAYKKVVYSVDYWVPKTDAQLVERKGKQWAAVSVGKRVDLMGVMKVERMVVDWAERKVDWWAVWRVAKLAVSKVVLTAVMMAVWKVAKLVNSKTNPLAVE